MEPLSEKDRNNFEKLMERTKDLELDETTALRFLRSSSFDLQKTEDTLRQRPTWYDKYLKLYFGTLSNLECWRAPFTKELHIFRCGYDLEGRPVFYIPFGTWTSATNLHERGFELDCLRLMAKCMESIYETLLKTKHQNMVTIVDMSGLTVRKALREFTNYYIMNKIIELAIDYETYYPGTLHKSFLINTPKIFYWGFNMIKPFLSKSILDKIHFYKKEMTEWLPVLQNNLPPNAIPLQFGGTAEMISFWESTPGL